MRRSTSNDSLSMCESVMSNISLCSNATADDSVWSVISESIVRRVATRVASKRAKRYGSRIAAVTTFIIFAWAIRSCNEAAYHPTTQRHQGSSNNGLRLATNDTRVAMMATDADTAMTTDGNTPAVKVSDHTDKTHKTSTSKNRKRARKLKK